MKGTLLNLVTVRKRENDGWIVNDRSARTNKSMPHFDRKIEAVKEAKNIARNKHSIYAEINERNEPTVVMNYGSRRSPFVKDRVRRTNILKAVVKTAINHHT